MSRVGRIQAELRRSASIGVVVFVSFAALIGFFIWNLPPMQDADKQVILANFPPKSLDSVTELAQVLRGYTSTNPVKVACTVCSVYMIMQTFMVPGTIGLSLLLGALYGPTRGFVVTALTSTSGSTLCYILSAFAGKPLVEAIWPDKLTSFQADVAKRRHQLFSYMLFLRVTPLLPNTFINMASPIAGVPPLIFITGTLVGVAPNNFMAARAGSHLSELHSLSDLYDKKIVGLALAAGCIAMAPVVWSWRQERLAAAAAAKQKKTS